MDFDNNAKIKLAYDFVFCTNKNVFLTGKAGTGKTTFLKNLHTEIPKRTVVVAPTGVAAINAGGVTIHSFFQLPFSPFIPRSSKNNLVAEDPKESVFAKNRLNKNKIKIIKSLDLLVIDEISMVRADVLDAIDDVLRRYRRNEKPFGGVQLLMIGDLHQLAPVVREEEWNFIKDYYTTSYFFGSNALKTSSFVTIELEHIYRQSDTKFIKLLGEIRENKLSTQGMELLNNRYIPNFVPTEKDNYIVLTTHNATAANINETRLAEIKGKKHVFKAKICDDFPEYMFPTEKELSLKVGSQVMFIKNDLSHDKLFYNGKIGKISKIERELIYVKCEDNYSDILVKTEIWENVQYTFNDTSKEIEELVIGSFEQYPLKLAWAITIHKSQGLTFDKAVIDINAAFAFGQVYVALSRCKTLEGMVLVSKLSTSAIKSDYTINEFSNNAQANAPDNAKLNTSKLNYQKELITEQFDFSEIKKNFYYFRKIFLENISKFDNSLINIISNIEHAAKNDIFNIYEKFINQINSLTQNEILPQDNARLQERIKKASEYYYNKIEYIFHDKLKEIYFDADNKEIKRNIADALEKLERNLHIKQQSLSCSRNGFETVAYLKATTNADIDFKPKLNRKTTDIYTGVVHNKEHSELYSELNSWRKMIAEDYNVPVFLVLQQNTLRELVEKLPADLKQLSKIKGIGKAKVNQYGEDILKIIDNYCYKNNIRRDKSEIEGLKPQKTEKTDTKLLSLELYKQGKNIQEIAKERGFVESTIFGHLAHYVIKGELDITVLMEMEKFEEISNYLEQKGNLSLRQLYEELDRKYMYNELRFVIEYLNALQK
jgi:hypothetical protein